MNDQSPLLDGRVIDELRESTGGDEGFLLDLVATYVGEVDAHLAGLDAAAAADDPALAVRPAHTLKSSSASVGAMRLAAIARSIEEAGREGRSDGLAAAVAEAREAWVGTLAALRAAGLAS